MSREGNILLEVETKSADDTRLLGQALAPFLQAGDMVILEGELGAGKTTLTQGLGAGLRVNQRVTSPTFIIARNHTKSPEVPGPNLVHVDAYRLTGGDDVETLDLESALETAVVVVEWGTGKVEGLSPHCLKLSLCAGLKTPRPPSREPSWICPKIRLAGWSFAVWRGLGTCRVWCRSGRLCVRRKARGRTPVLSQSPARPGPTRK